MGMQENKGGNIMSEQFISAKRGITGDGKTVLSPIWIGIDGGQITYDICNSIVYAINY